MQTDNLSWQCARNMLRVGLCTSVIYQRQFKNFFFLRNNVIWRQFSDDPPHLGEPSCPELLFKIYDYKDKICK